MIVFAILNQAKPAFLCYNEPMTKEIGAAGEAIATQFLLQAGFKILGRNVVRVGVEADILAQHGKTTVVVEVKTKTHLDYGLPQEMVGYHKQKRLRRFAESLLAENPRQAVRVDVVAVTLTDGEPVIEHLENVVEE